MSKMKEDPIEERLIEAVKCRPPLYTNKSKTLQAVILKDTLWNEVSAETEMPVDVCKMKWKMLRDYYCRQKKCKLGDPDSIKTKLEFKRMETLDFLSRHYQEQNHLWPYQMTQIKTSPKAVSSESRKERVKGSKVTKEPVMIQLLSLDSISDLKWHTKGKRPNTNEGLLKIKSGPSSESPSKRQKFDLTASRKSEPVDVQVMVEPAEVSLKRLKESPTSVDSMTEDLAGSYTIDEVEETDSQRGARLSLSAVSNMSNLHPIDIMFCGFASTVKSFPPRFQIEAKKKIFDVISDLEFEILSEETM